jgi:uncharacterized protein YjbK
MPALKSPSVIVLDNASYHNIKTEETVVPNFNQRKAVLQGYLSKHNIPFHPLKNKKNTFMKKSNLRNPFPFLKLIKLPTYTVTKF